MSEFIRLLQGCIEQQGLSVNDHQLVQFDIYRRELKDWNTRVNLTSLTDNLDIIDKHFMDSLLLVRYVPLGHWIRIADVGTGAGFPGLPIKIYQPDIRLSLLESTGKKTKFLSHIITELKLENVDVVNERAEVAARIPEHREQYSLVVARGVARLPVLAEYCLPLLSVGGKFVAYKGREAEVEVEESESALDELGGRFEKIERDTTASPESASTENKRALVFIEKVKETPDKYPRRPGIPRKRPLQGKFTD
jgi:16S rRNA (guanine527-N7)-methyltransferase